MASAEDTPHGRPPLRVIEGGGQRQEEPLTSRDAVARLLLGAGVDVLLRRITPERAEVIEGEVNAVLDLFDQVERLPALAPLLEQRLQALESLAREQTPRRRQPVRLRSVRGG